MKRTVDGRVQLRHKDGTWFQLKLDNEVKGTLLLRNSQTGEVHVLQTDKLEQVSMGLILLPCLHHCTPGCSCAVCLKHGYFSLHVVYQ